MRFFSDIDKIRFEALSTADKQEVVEQGKGRVVMIITEPKESQDVFSTKQKTYSINTSEGHDMKVVSELIENRAKNK